MPLPNGRILAYNAQRTTGQAIQDLYQNGLPMDSAKALALARLVEALATMQTRLRRMNRRHKKPKTTSPKPRTTIHPPSIIGEASGTVLGASSEQAPEAGSETIPEIEKKQTPL